MSLKLRQVEVSHSRPGIYPISLPLRISQGLTDNVMLRLQP